MRSFTDAMYNRRQFAPPVSDHVNALVLVASAQQRQAIPDGASFVVFSSGSTYYVLFGDADVAAQIPGAAVSDGSAAERTPEAREVPEGATHVSVISSDGGVVTLAWYGL